MNRVIVLERKRRKPKKVVRVWKKKEVSKNFKMARVNYPACVPIRLPNDPFALIANAWLALRLGPAAFWAVDEMRAVMLLSGWKPVSGANYDRVPGGTGEWNNKQIEMYRRYRTWAYVMSLDEPLCKCRDAAIFYVMGYGLREIERDLNVRQGAGRGKQMIETGIRWYCEMAGWIRGNNVI